jgi:hypothetical protein
VSAAIEADTLSELLLELYAGCHELPMQAFLPHALAIVRRRLSFDSAWWAMSTVAGEAHDIHASYVEGLPSNMHELWLSIQQDDVIGHAVLEQPGCTLNFKPSDVDRTEGSRWLARSTGFRHVLCTVNTNPIIGQHHFLALSRHDAEHCFLEPERRLKELLMPHLNATLDINRITELRRMHAQGDARRHPMAVVDRLGAIHHAEPAFVEQLRQHWPRWWGPRVPAMLLESLNRADAWRRDGPVVVGGRPGADGDLAAIPDGSAVTARERGGNPIRGRRVVQGSGGGIGHGASHRAPPPAHGLRQAGCGRQDRPGPYGQRFAVTRGLTGDQVPIHSQAQGGLIWLALFEHRPRRIRPCKVRVNDRNVARC